MQLFLDCDGVLANFDKLYTELCGMHPREYEELNGSKSFWDVVNKHGTFFADLEPLPDAYELVEAVRELNPIVLTGGSSKTDEYQTRFQKENWVEKHFPGVPVIVTRSAIKYQSMHPEKHNILIDDWPEYKHVWEQNGGTFIQHTDTKSSLEKLWKVLRLAPQALC